MRNLLKRKINDELLKKESYGVEEKDVKDNSKEFSKENEDLKSNTEE